MSEEIYMDDIECPYCDRDTYLESWDISVDPYGRKQRTEMTCDECGGKFYIITSLDVTIEKEKLLK